MSLPISRNTTYVAGVSEVKSADLNDLQDKTLDIWKGLTQIISPAALAGGSTTHNYAPAGLVASTQLLRQARSGGGGGLTVTGLVAGVDGQTLWFVNLSNAVVQNITLKMEDAGSTAANRFAIPADIAIPPDGAVLLYYDGTTSRWRVLAKSL